MIEVFLTIWGPLLLIALAGGVIGWFWHALRVRPRQRALEAERRRLRGELLDLMASGAAVTGVAPMPDDENSRRRIADLERALAEARGRGAEADVLRTRLAELEQHARVRPAVDVTDYTKRIAALEVEIEAARRKVAEAEALQARLAALEAAPPPAPAPLSAPAPVLEAPDTHRWRARYFEARTRYLTQTAKTAEADAAALRGRLTALEAQPPAPAEDAEKTQLIWRNRYLTERLRYLEGQGSGADSQESEERRRWRMRYMEQRVAHLEARRPQPAAPVDVTPFKARIAELETKLGDGEASAAKLVEAEDDAIRATWTRRYQQSRVNYLEGHLRKTIEHEAGLKRAIADAVFAKEAAETARARADEETAGARAALERAQADAADARAALQRTQAEATEARVAAARAPVAPEPAFAAPPRRLPEPAVVRLERPPTLSGARNGAPDDFTLIDGVSAQSAAALHALGVHHFDQIAAWSDAHVNWVNQYFNLGGRISQYRWVEQASKLAARR